MDEFPAIDRALEADAMQTLFFIDKEVQGKLCRVSAANYLAFLSMKGSEIAAEIEKLKTLFQQHASEKVEHDVVRLLKARNWRGHNIACVVLACGFASEKMLSALWQCIRLGSWVSPQLAATAAFVDPNFKAMALSLVDDKCTYYKSIIALDELLRRQFGVRIFPLSRKGFNVRKARSIDRDNLGAIAASWHASLQDVLNKGSPEEELVKSAHHA